MSGAGASGGRGRSEEVNGGGASGGARDREAPPEPPPPFTQTLGDRVRRGEEDNPLLLSFYGGDQTHVHTLARSEFHRVNSCVEFRKELTESMALVEALRDMRAGQGEGNGAGGGEAVSWEGWQLIDVCCGSSLTTALCLAMLPGVVVTPCDIVGEETLPHFAEAGFADRVSYCQHDIMRPDFVSALKHHLRQGMRYCVLGMHCCGELSLRALEIFEEIHAETALIIPCCLPSKAS